MFSCCFYPKEKDAVVVVETITHVKEKEKKKKKPKKKTRIPAALRYAVWKKYMGDLGKAKCPVCELTDITPFDFQCGHIVAEACGGPTNLENLKPICGLCNVSSQTRNMDEFKKTHFTT